MEQKFRPTALMLLIHLVLDWVTQQALSILGSYNVSPEESDRMLPYRSVCETFLFAFLFALTLESQTAHSHIIFSHCVELEVTLCSVSSVAPFKELIIVLLNSISLTSSAKYYMNLLHHEKLEH